MAGVSICKNYLRPGLTAPLQRNHSADNAQIHLGSLPDNCGNSNNLPRSGVFCREQHLTTNNDTNTKVNDDALVHDNFQDAMDDDAILENIDVDQIVMEHYQATCTPEGSVSKGCRNTPFTPVDHRSNIMLHEEDNLPAELCEICVHGLKLAFCSEAAAHLQELKDRLIAVSNELLDNAADLSPQHSENLRQERLQLNKKIQQLEKYMQRIRSNVHIGSESGYGGTWNSPMPFSYTDNLGVPSAPVEREVFTPKLIDVKYIEGSSDKRWKSMDFPWTKKLEANNRKVFGNHSFAQSKRGD
uniref:Uncharacterized protein n=1 Tax=Ananas comosus var. bracteatus TaxID=296719 RepID=A0A6V7P1N3_ANACO|nr:unnamed protein product [Ananas comosus var. bracteatus]